MELPPTNYFKSLEDILTGSVLLIDKPLNWTSFDVVNKIKWYVRHHLKAPKFKIGHAGTLDPLATGVLVICTGRCTKSIESIQGGEKEYTGTIFLGKTTPSYDLETEPSGEFSIEHITEEELRKTAASFIGEQMQQPPVFSAKWVDGKRAYKSARRGEHVEIPKVFISVTAVELTRIELPEVDFRIRCSKGTYIRTIAHEFGQRLNSGSHLTALRRTSSFPFVIEDSLTMDDLYARLDRISENAML